MWITVGVLFVALLVLKAISFSGAAPVRPNNVSELPGCPASPNCVCSQNTTDEQRIAPIKISGDPVAALEKLKNLIERLGGKLVDEKTGTYARFEFRSRLFRYVDDVEILLDSEAKQIDIRSASRSGYSDFGVNRKRVEKIRSEFSKR